MSCQKIGDQFAPDPGRQRHVTITGLLNAGQQSWTAAILHQVSGGPGAQSGNDVLLSAEGGQSDDAGAAMLPIDLANGIHPRHVGHLKIHEHHIGFQLLVGLHGLPPVAGLTNHLVIVVSRQEHAVGLTDHGIIISD